ncbi:ABC transporter ATP-binding protein [soil metagenome]
MIKIKGVTKSFKGFKAVNNLNLQVAQGEYLALLGPNGAGKTTLVEMIEGLQFPDSGEILVKGMNWRDHVSQLRRVIGLSLQETKFIDKITVKETMDLFASFYNLPDQRSEELINAVNLNHKRDSYTVNLSGGQRQKLALGVALLNDPEVLMLDEPTTGLDPNARREIWDILINIKQSKKTTLILTTHYMEEAEYLCDRIVIMNNGSILADGTLQELLQRLSQGEIIKFEASSRPEEGLLEGITGFVSLTWKDKQAQGQMIVESSIQAIPQLINALQKNGIELLELESRKKTLDDLFIAMTGRSLNE